MSYFQRKYLRVWLSLAKLPIGLGLYVLAMYIAPDESSFGYYLFVNIFAVPFVLVVWTFWDSFDGARVWAKYFLYVQPFLWFLFFWPH